MEILLDSTIGFSPVDLKKYLDADARVKFVMIEAEQRIAKLFGNLSHSSEANSLLDEYEDATFVGAGAFRKKLYIQWDSDSCTHEFGYDRPEENSDQILAEFKEALLQFIPQ
jgi:hypothetical protein